MKKRSKRYSDILKSKVSNKKLNTKEILDLVKNSNLKFDESLMFQ